MRLRTFATIVTTAALSVGTALAQAAPKGLQVLADDVVYYRLTNASAVTP